MRYIWRRSLVIVMLTLVMAGCAIVEDKSEHPAGVADADEPPAEPGAEDEAPARRGKPPATAAGALALAKRAETASANGDNATAASMLERALRIAPDSAVLWQNLAVVRYRQGRHAQAEQLAQRSNTLAATDTALQRQNWALIAAVRRLQGDAVGAREAAARARSLKNGGTSR